ncbi:MAG: MBL fold metallo-hydrolase [Syntrophomonadaceae bacterium]|nr:MBL fold metallo-hydrolase [Syntrophomonadaceae bacterium]
MKTSCPFLETPRKINTNSFNIHILRGYIENIIIIEYNHALLLLDSGCINDISRIEFYIRQTLQRPMQDIKLIAVSHMHPDHAGGAAFLRKKYQIPIAAHPDTDRWYAAPGGALQQMLDCYMATSVARHNHRRLQRICYKRKLRPDYLINDGDTLPFFPDWKALHVPGHTLHDLVFHHPADKVLYIADLICEVKGKHQLPLPILFKDKMSHSFDKLGKINAKTIIRAHGEVIYPDSCTDLFDFMKSLLEKPDSKFVKRINLMSIYTPEIKRHNPFDI